MREYTVKVLGSTYQVTEKDRYWAASQGVRLYLKEHLGTKYNFTSLMSLVSARLVHPETPGRKAVLYGYNN